MIYILASLGDGLIVQSDCVTYVSSTDNWLMVEGCDGNSIIISSCGAKQHDLKDNENCDEVQLLQAFQPVLAASLPLCTEVIIETAPNITSILTNMDVISV